MKLHILRKLCNIIKIIDFFSNIKFNKNIKSINKFNKKYQKLNSKSKKLDKYLIPQELEKKKNGEISTPYKLRQEIIDKLEEYKPNFFKKKRTVFEPWSGKGGFFN